MILSTSSFLIVERFVRNDPRRFDVSFKDIKAMLPEVSHFSMQIFDIIKFDSTISTIPSDPRWWRISARWRWRWPWIYSSRVQ